MRYRFNTKERRFTIGPYPEVKLSDARARAMAIRGNAELGTDAQEKRRTERDR